jgi:hypothetical protein
MSEAAEQQNHKLSAADRHWIQSVGNIAAPLLAGFSFTAAITLSDDFNNFRWASAAILSLAVAAIALIGAVQFSKYARNTHPNPTRWHWATRISYHTGIVALLLGFAFALAPPQHAEPPVTPRWAAFYLALAACGVEAFFFLKDIGTRLHKRC